MLFLAKRDGLGKAETLLQDGLVNKWLSPSLLQAWIPRGKYALLEVQAVSH